MFSRGQNKGEVGPRVLYISISNSMRVGEKRAFRSFRDKTLLLCSLDLD